MLHPGPERGTGLKNTTASPTVRRRELGALLKALRTERGWTAEHVGERLRFSPSKMSRLETGHRGASPRDIKDLCDLYGVDDDQRQRLLELASEGKQRGWWQPLGLPYSEYVGLEAEAVSISDFGLGYLPGLLQTADYARAIVRAAVPRWVPEIVEQRVQGRMTRQEQFLYGENPPKFDAVVDESVLHRVVGGRDIMRAQLERLLELSERPNITLRVIPYEAGALPAGNNKFIVLRFASAEVRDVVYIEGLTGEVWVQDPEEVEIYTTTFRTLIQLAKSPKATREVIAAMIPTYRGKPGRRLPRTG